MNITTKPPKTPSVTAELSQRYARLIAVIEKSAKEVESRTGRPEVTALQRRAISALQECAEIALGLADCVGEQTCPRDITCLHLGDWNRCSGCFTDQVSRFFDQAGKFLTAVVANRDAAPIVAPPRLFSEQNRSDAFSARAASFTEAQNRVFELLVTGMPNKLIAYEIGVSEATVKAHVSAVLRKLKVRSRAQAIALSAFDRNRNGMATVAV